MVQAADRRQFGATSTPPSLPALNWRRDLPKSTFDWAPPGAFFAGGTYIAGGDLHGSGAPNTGASGVGAIAAAPRSRRADRPAAVMVLAPVLGLAIWIGLLALI